MRIGVLALATGAVLALTAPAFAQMGSMGQMGQMSLGGMPSLTPYQYGPGDQTLSRDYVKKVTALSYRVLALRAQDGGELTPEHLGGLRRELDQLKRRYHVVADFQVSAR
jgi:hypothetical protein